MPWLVNLIEGLILKCTVITSLLGLLVSRTILPSSGSACCALDSSITQMAIEFSPLPLPASADPSHFVDFGREVKGVHPGDLTPPQFAEIHDALYKVSGPTILP